ncbi:MAG: alpha-glucan family phosphorylase [Thiocapsa sp.]|jgi:starch phosphorylase|nr:alpha-glucan family phosphorylase [Thiocapsa sp.]MCG6897907.1 alpha-glucan family phosphorylase [Thiocapsa sp.]
MQPLRYLPRPVPDALAGLVDLAVDLRWSWSHCADALWRCVDAELWDATGDPWLILESVSQNRLDELAADPRFLRDLAEQVASRENQLKQQTWFDSLPDAGDLGTVAYFSMEYGLSEALPIYSGGLGVLAGDHLKTASDLGVPLVGVGLLYQQGYFRQTLDAQGEQLELFPYNNPSMLPVLPLRDTAGGWLRIDLELPGRTLRLRGWEARIGRVRLYLLDSNDLLNTPGDRGITSELYGGGPELRLQQELVLGVGGWRLLEALGIAPDLCHLNEGHAALAVLERARSFMNRTQRGFRAALSATRAGNLFTTHTPVAAGFDRFAPDLIARYLGSYAQSLGLSRPELLALGRADPKDATEPFNMAYLAVRGSGAVNGVSRLHGVVSRRIFEPLFPRWPTGEVPIGHVTNGVHVPSWDSAAADDLWTKACGKGRWLGALEAHEDAVRALTDEALWRFRTTERQSLVDAVRARQERQLATSGQVSVAVPEPLDPDILTLGFARRFAAYKRPDLLLRDPARLLRLITDPRRPVQLVIAGKAHPQDQVGRQMIRRWSDFACRPELRGRVVFLADYDLAMAADLVQGVDLWINTPRRPWEASGTSGMKLLVNGGLNLSELDGWWAEAWSPDVGWALGDGREHGDDPAWDEAEASGLCALLEQEVIPSFYDRDASGVPTSWVARMRESMARLTPRFSSNRMVREYTELYYLPAAAAQRRRCAALGRLGAEIAAWQRRLAEGWPSLRLAERSSSRSGSELRFAVEVCLDDLPATAIRLELYAEPLKDGDTPQRIPMERLGPLPGPVQGFLYAATVDTDRPPEHFTARVVPFHAEASVPLEAPWILWQG